MHPINCQLHHFVVVKVVFVRQSRSEIGDQILIYPTNFVRLTTVFPRSSSMKLSALDEYDIVSVPCKTTNASK